MSPAAASSVAFEDQVGERVAVTDDVGDGDVQLRMRRGPLARPARDAARQHAGEQEVRAAPRSARAPRRRAAARAPSGTPGLGQGDERRLDPRRVRGLPQQPGGLDVLGVGVGIGGAAADEQRRRLGALAGGRTSSSRACRAAPGSPGAGRAGGRSGRPDAGMARPARGPAQPGMSPLAWPAATSTSGTASRSRGARPRRGAATASRSGGGDSSMKPPRDRRRRRCGGAVGDALDEGAEAGHAGRRRGCRGRRSAAGGVMMRGLVPRRALGVA